MTLKHYLACTAILTLIAVGAIYFASITLIGEAANPGNLPSLTSTSSAIDLFTDGDPIHVLFEPRTSCSARIVSTGFNPIMLAFEADSDPINNQVSSTTLSQAVGHWQSASSTEHYSAENFGCGWVTGLTAGGAASPSISVTESY